MTNVEDRLAQIVLARGARLRIDIRGREGNADDRLAAALETILRGLAHHVVPGGDLVLVVADRAGGDTEIAIDGLRLPDRFPEATTFADLWTFAERFLVEFHRVRLAQDQTRVLILVPAAERARALRGHPV